MKHVILFVMAAIVFSAEIAMAQSLRRPVLPYDSGRDHLILLQLMDKASAGKVPLKLQKAGQPINSIQTIGDAAAWLLTQQDPSGGFPWTVGDPNLYSNVQGPAGRGMLAGYNATTNAAYLNSAIDCGNYLVPNYPRTYPDGDPKIATHDPLFLEELTIVTGDPKYANFLQSNFWDKLTAGTYGENNDLDAYGFGMAVIGGRAASGIIELAPWDLSATTIGAHVAGETAIQNALMSTILNGLDSTTTADNTYDIIGLAGAIWASAVTGIDLNPTVGRYAAQNSTLDLINILLTYQNAQGGWIWSSTVDISDPANGDVQTTAFAILALKAYDPVAYATEISNGITFLFSLQQPSGQFLAYPGAASTAAGGVEVHAEAMQALGSNKDSLIPVELTSLVARVMKQGVIITWSTASETENLGFHVYRSMQADGEYHKITEKIIPGHGNTAEAHSYEFMDEDVQMGKTYYYKLADIDYNGELTFHGPVSVTVAEMPKAYALAQNYPNPFNPSTTIAFSLPEAAHVTLEIYSTTGQKVRTLVAGDLAAGRHSILWDATDARGNRVASGVYLYRLTARGVVLQKKLVLAR